MKYLSKIKPLYFQVVMIAITLVSSSSYLRIKLGSFAVYGLAFGVFICLITLFDGTFKKVISEKENWLLFAFCGFYLISIFLCWQSGLVENIKQLIFMVVFFYLLTMVTQLRSKEEKIKDLKVVVWVYVVLTFVVALVSFNMFVTRFSYCAQDPLTNLWYEMGMVGRRLAGLYNSNTSASIFAVSIIVSVFLLLDSNRVGVKYSSWKKSFCIINGLLQFTCLILTASRGAIYSFYIAIFVASFLLMYKSSKMENEIKKFIMITISSLLVLVIIFGAETVLRMSLEYVPGLINSSSNTTSIVSNPIILNVEKFDLERQYDTVSSGRIIIWKSSINIIKDNLFFGVPYESLKEVVPEYLLDNGVSTDYLNAGGTFHNIIISCLVSSGIIGFFPIVMFIIINLASAISFAFNHREYYVIELLPLIVVIMALCNEMVESRILYTVNILNVMFWIMMGYLPNEKKDAT